MATHGEHASKDQSRQGNGPHGWPSKKNIWSRGPAEHAGKPLVDHNFPCEHRISPMNTPKWFSFASCNGGICELSKFINNLFGQLVNFIIASEIILLAQARVFALNLFRPPRDLRVAGDG